MDLKEIVTRDTSLDITQEESLFVLKSYVKIRKGKNIEPVIITDMPTIFIQGQLQLMGQMTIHAVTWLNNNLDKIK